MGFIDNIIRYLHERFDRQTIGLLATLLIALTLPLTIFLAMQTQLLRQRAAESNVVTFTDVSGNPLPDKVSDPNLYLPHRVSPQIMSRILLGDIDGNGVVDVKDYAILVDQFGKSGSNLSSLTTISLLRILGRALVPKKNHSFFSIKFLTTFSKNDFISTDAATCKDSVGRRGKRVGKVEIPQEAFLAALKS